MDDTQKILFGVVKFEMPQHQQMQRVNVSADSAAVAEDMQQSMQKFGISLSIVIGVILVPIITIAILKPANVSSRIIAAGLRKPRLMLIGILVVSLICEIAIAAIPSPEVRNGFAMVTRMVNVSMWIFATLVFCAWLVIETYDSYAAQSGWFSSTDVTMLLTPAGRDTIFEYRSKKNPKFKHLEPYVSLKKTKLHVHATEVHPRLDIRPTRWLQHVASKETRELWAPILEAFLPYAKNVKENVLKRVDAAAAK